MAKGFVIFIIASIGFFFGFQLTASFGPLFVSITLAICVSGIAVSLYELSVEMVTEFKEFIQCKNL